MNEITRIHIAKTAYDIEIAAKKQLEKYITSLEAYTQDKDVLADIEIRITELLAERGVAAGGVVSSDDVKAIRAQLGEPHEFADGEGDIAIGATLESSGRRLYRSTDDAVLGGVLSGVAAYFNINPLWLRLVFIFLLFVSFGTASLIYIVLWVLIPPARTATEKLQLAGRDVTLGSIKELNSDEETAPRNRVAPVLQQILAIGLGTFSLLGAVVTSIFTIWIAISAITFNEYFMNMTNGFTGLGDGNAWIAWLVFGIVVFGLLLLTALFGLVAYAFFKKKFTKRMLISAIIITVLGIAAVGTTIGISATQSLRVANETRNMVIETKANLPVNFANVTDLKISQKTNKVSGNGNEYFSHYAVIRYVVDSGQARYEWSALPSTKVSVTTEGTTGVVTVEVPSSFRNSFVQPVLTIYGPALKNISSNVNNGGTQVSYDGVTQDELTIESLKNGSNMTINGSYERMIVKGEGTVHLGLSTIRSLTVDSKHGLTVTAGTVNELTVTQPNVCPTGTYGGGTSITVDAVASNEMTYNGVKMSAESQETSCAILNIGTEEERYGENY